MAQYIESLDFPPGTTPTTEAPVRKSWLDTPDWVNAEVEVNIATFQAYQIMYYAFTALMAVMGLDKFLHILSTWEPYVSPAIASSLHMSAGSVTVLAGLIELAAAAAVALKPRIGSWVVTGWLWLIVINLLTMTGHYDMVISNLALSAAGLAFTRLAAECN